MSKVSRENKFLDLSDYGRKPAKLFAELLLNTRFTSIHVTFLFLLLGILAIFCILNQLFFAAFFLLILKSIMDAADGELSRIKNKPSLVGRYLDSNFDILLNFGFLYSIYSITSNSLLIMVLAFFSMQLQGTLYNYYSTILRNNIPKGDTTSRVQESGFPQALTGENQKLVNILFVSYKIMYGVFDNIIYVLDSSAKNVVAFPKWFMSLVSIYGLGFQLLIIGSLLITGYVEIILPFFIYYSVFILILIGIRKIFIVK
ncbi:MAG: CDP-alcohol phosphatidyltransferase family protein [Bacteroidetes bacterium]|nr:CDP-alcohol phosphatidyltransferase family protein [Bacteroidota bacterium]